LLREAVSAVAKGVGEGLDAVRLDIPGLWIFRSPRNEDQRGFVQPTYNAEFFRDLGIEVSFVHENHCFSAKRGTVRGFHYQLPPHGQPKLVRVTRGSILDVNVDLRRGSPHFGRHAAVTLTPDGPHSIFVPSGFAHCYCTLEDDSEVFFKLGSLFAPTHARGLAWNDPDFGIDWPITEAEAIVLDRDLDRPRFSEITDLFSYPDEAGESAS
jgi:dTDP-4-dehydrorhamnose 3,5-epimerase